MCICVFVCKAYSFVQCKFLCQPLSDSAKGLFDEAKAAEEAQLAAEKAEKDCTALGFSSVDMAMFRDS